MSLKINATVCRVCLKSRPGSNRRLFTGDTLEKFCFATLVQANENDGLPQILCDRCFGRMRIAYDFKKQTIEADNHYRKFIQDVNKKFQNLTHSEEYIEEEVIEEEQVYLDDDDDETKEIILETMGDDGQGHIIEDATTIMDIIEIKDEKHSDTIPEYMHEEQLFDAEEQDDGEVLVANDLGDDCDATIDDDDEEQYGDEVQDGRMLDGETIYDEEHLDDQQVFLYIGDNMTETVESSETRSPTKSSSKRSRATSHFCSKCSKVFSTRTNLTRHQMTHNGQKPYECHICGGRFTQNGSLKSHMLIHTGERPFVCQVCNKGFTQSKSLSFHMRRHTGEKPFSCEHCEMNFRQKDGLKRHLATKHSGDDSQKYPCLICGRILMTKASYRFHTNRHLASKGGSLTCATCDKVFLSKSTLIAHMKKHANHSTEMC